LCCFESRASVTAALAHVRQHSCAGRIGIASASSMTAVSAPLGVLQPHWVISVLLLTHAGVLAIPTYTRFVRDWPRHHPVVQACVAIIIPDIAMVRRFYHCHMPRNVAATIIVRDELCV
jgi:hypothetical protein